MIPIVPIIDSPFQNFGTVDISSTAARGLYGFVRTMIIYVSYGYGINPEISTGWAFGCFHLLIYLMNPI